MDSTRRLMPRFYLFRPPGLLPPPPAPPTPNQCHPSRLPAGDRPADRDRYLYMHLDRYGNTRAPCRQYRTVSLSVHVHEPHGPDTGLLGSWPASRTRKSARSRSCRGSRAAYGRDPAQMWPMYPTSSHSLALSRSCRKSAVQVIIVDPLIVRKAACGLARRVVDVSWSGHGQRTARR